MLTVSIARAERTEESKRLCANADNEAPQADRLLVVKKEYCNFCGDLMGQKMNVCQDCGAYVCEQNEKYATGCIYLGTVLANAPFRCIVCDSRHWRGQETPPMGGLPVSIHFFFS